MHCFADLLSLTAKLDHHNLVFRSAPKAKLTRIDVVQANKA